jgi:hypothetical protein
MGPSRSLMLEAAAAFLNFLFFFAEQTVPVDEQQ